jgi:hypothetical protein
MSRALTRNILVLAAVVLVATGCNDFGYVELKTVPSTGRAVLYLDNERLDPPRSGIAVLRQAVGTRKLQTEAAGGQPSLLCDIVVKKDRITTVTVSTFERPPRCTCARPSGNDAEGRRTCIG